MYDKELTIEILCRIEELISELISWTENIKYADDFSSGTEGVILLNAVCMKLIAIGEEVKSVDYRTKGELLSKYKNIPWKDVMGLRDIIAHHYFDVDACEIFSVISNDLPPLQTVIRKMQKDIAGA
jgi:Uncharacterized conserved protein